MENIKNPKEMNMIQKSQEKMTNIEARSRWLNVQTIEVPGGKHKSRDQNKY